MLRLTESSKMTTSCATEETQYVENNEISEFTSVRVYGHFRQSPLNQRIILCAVALILSVTLNFFVYKHYIKSKTSNRPYVLTLVFLDIFSLVTGLVPTFVLSLFDSSKTVQDLQFYVYGVTKYLVTIYICTPMFLCIDRLFSVYVPHKIQEYRSKIRVLKSIIGFLFASASTMSSMSERYFGLESEISISCRVIAWSIAICLLVATTGMYIAIAVRLYRRNKGTLAQNIAW